VLGDWDTYVEQVTDTVLPPLSDRFPQPPTLNRFATVLGEGLLVVFNVWGGVGSEAGGAATTTATTTAADSANGEGGGFSSGGSGSGSENEAGQALGAAAMLAAYQAVVEAATYPPCFMVLKVRVWWLASLSLQKSPPPTHLLLWFWNTLSLHYSPFLFEKLPFLLPTLVLPNQFVLKYIPHLNSDH
jgi:hypothetical protein